MALGERGAAVSDMVADVALGGLFRVRCGNSLRSGRCRTYVRSAIDVEEPGLGVKQRKGKKRGCSDVKLHENQPASSWLFASRAVRGDCLIGVEIAAEFFEILELLH